MSRLSILTILFASFFCTTSVRAANTLLVEAESFSNPGGWLLDTQFTHIMGSPYLLAHGLGSPVKDATTTITLPAPGKYYVHVRTKDWVAQWKAPGTPGRFQLLIDDKPLQTTFGTQGAQWHWQTGGVIDVKQTKITVALHDLTGFEGRCDAILFTDDPTFRPPNDLKEMTAWRKKTLGLPDAPIDGGNYDVVIIGGGYGGMGAAISAARMGCKVALIQDRPVLGGNGSSEIRVWSMGGTTLGKYPKLGEIVEEFADSAKSSPGTQEEFGDDKKEIITTAEKNITLRLGTQAFAVEMKDGKIAAILARDMRSSAETRFTAKLFVDATGHGVIGALAGAEYDMAQREHMGMSNMWRWSESDKPVAFPETPWALQLTLADFPYPKNGKAEWFWEGGFNRHPIDDLEYIRDWNFRAVYGAFATMKNGEGKDKHQTAKLDWLAYIGGNRESRLLKGDLTLTREDIINKVEYPDATVPTTWSIDLHVPKEQYAQKFPDDPFISKAIFDARVDKKNGYPVPYRCFYSKNIPNLFMAGRHISVDRGALGSTRVMRTIGMMGEVVGKAASICIKHDCLPRAVYESHWDEMKELLTLPGNARRQTVTAKIDPAAPLPADVSNTRAKPHRMKDETAAAASGIPINKLPGLIIDDAQAKLKGAWSAGQGIKGFVGASYQYDTGPKGECEARFDINPPANGRYEIRIKYAEHENRDTKAPITLIHADGEKTLEINQQIPGKAEAGFESLGIYNLSTNKPAAVIITNKGVKGHVSIDAVQVLPAK